jgi:hypothetical protein
MPRKRLLVPTAIAKYLAERSDLEARSLGRFKEMERP